MDAVCEVIMDSIREYYGRNSNGELTEDSKVQDEKMKKEEEEEKEEDNGQKNSHIMETSEGEKSDQKREDEKKLKEEKEEDDNGKKSHITETSEGKKSDQKEEEKCEDGEENDDDERNDEKSDVDDGNEGEKTDEKIHDDKENDGEKINDGDKTDDEKTEHEHDIDDDVRDEDKPPLYEFDTSKMGLLRATIDLSDNRRLTSQGVHTLLALLRSLRKLVHVKCLKLYKCDLDDDAGKDLASFIEHQQEPVDELHLSHNRLTHVSLIALIVGLRNHGSYPKGLCYVDEGKYKIKVKGSSYTSNNIYGDADGGGDDDMVYYYTPCWMRIEYNCIPRVDALMSMIKDSLSVNLCTASRRDLCGPWRCSRHSIFAVAHLYAINQQRDIAHATVSAKMNKYNITNTTSGIVSATVTDEETANNAPTTGIIGEETPNEGNMMITTEETTTNKATTAIIGEESTHNQAPLTITVEESANNDTTAMSYEEVLTCTAEDITTTSNNNNASSTSNSPESTPTTNTRALKKNSDIPPHDDEALKRLINRYAHTGAGGHYDRVTGLNSFGDKWRDDEKGHKGDKLKDYGNDVEVEDDVEDDDGFSSTGKKDRKGEGKITKKKDTKKKETKKKKEDNKNEKESKKKTKTKTTTKTTTDGNTKKNGESGNTAQHFGTAASAITLTSSYYHIKEADIDYYYAGASKQAMSHDDHHEHYNTKNIGGYVDKYDVYPQPDSHTSQGHRESSYYTCRSQSYTSHHHLHQSSTWNEHIYDDDVVHKHKKWHPRNFEEDGHCKKTKDGEEWKTSNHGGTGYGTDWGGGDSYSHGRHQPSSDWALDHYDYDKTKDYWHGGVSSKNWYSNANGSGLNSKSIENDKNSGSKNNKKDVPTTNAGVQKASKVVDDHSSPYAHFNTGGIKNNKAKNNEEKNAPPPPLIPRHDSDRRPSSNDNPSAYGVNNGSDNNGNAFFLDCPSVAPATAGQGKKEVMKSIANSNKTNNIDKKGTTVPIYSCTPSGNGVAHAIGAPGPSTVIVTNTTSTTNTTSSWFSHEKDGKTEEENGRKKSTKKDAVNKDFDFDSHSHHSHLRSVGGDNKKQGQMADIQGHNERGQNANYYKKTFDVNSLQKQQHSFDPHTGELKLRCLTCGGYVKQNQKEVKLVLSMCGHTFCNECFAVAAKSYLVYATKSSNQTIKVPCPVCSVPMERSEVKIFTDSEWENINIKLRGSRCKPDVAALAPKWGTTPGHHAGIVKAKNEPEDESEAEKTPSSRDQDRSRGGKEYKVAVTNRRKEPMVYPEQVIDDRNFDLFVCAFCYGVSLHPVLTTCSHIFCMSCFQSWVGDQVEICKSQKKKCTVLPCPYPGCNNPLKKADVTDVVNNGIKTDSGPGIKRVLQCLNSLKIRCVNHPSHQSLKLGTRGKSIFTERMAALDRKLCSKGVGGDKYAAKMPRETHQFNGMMLKKTKDENGKTVTPCCGWEGDLGAFQAHVVMTGCSAGSQEDPTVRRRPSGYAELRPGEAVIDSRPALSDMRNYRKAMFAFEPQGEGQISLKVGDIVEILQLGDKGWAAGRVLNVANNAYGDAGWFPRNYLD